MRHFSLVVRRCISPARRPEFIWISLFPALLACLAGQSAALADASTATQLHFYQQLIDLEAPRQYVPTRTFTVIRDESGDRLVADDDAQLQFNMLWLRQYEEGYRYREGGAALGRLVRTYLKNAWRNYRSSHAQLLSAAPDENGSGGLGAFSTDMEYRLRWSDDEVTLGLEYRY